MAVNLTVLTPVEMRVLVCLTEIAREGEITITTEALTDRLGLRSRRWVMKTIVELEGAGLVQRVPTWRPDGRRGPNRYVLVKSFQKAHPTM